MNVLIVENDAIVAQMWAEKLQKFYNVSIAESVKAAIDFLDQESPDIVLLDLRLNGPTNSGLNVYDHIRYSLNKRTPVIFISGLEWDTDLVRRAQLAVTHDAELGIKTYFEQKPIRISALADAVKAVA